MEAFNYFLALMVSRYLEGAIYACEVCTLQRYTIEYDDGYNSYTTTGYYWDCVTYYGYLYDGTGGGGDDNRDFDDPGSGGRVIVNPYDNNKDGFIDCYKNTIMKVSGLFISSDCNEQRSYGLNNAWDITGIGVDGKQIFSASDGTVLEVGVQVDRNTGELTGWGYYVKIKDKEENIWIYAHLNGTKDDPSGIGLSVGSELWAGITPIGVVGSSGNSSGPHLHLELWLNGNKEQKSCPDIKVGRC